MFSKTVSAIHTAFNHHSLRKSLERLRYPLALVLFGLLAFQVRREWFLPGLAVGLGGEAIQLWCFAVLRKNRVLTREGPYALMRNPMYVGRFFLLLGILLLTGRLWLLPLFAALYYFYAVNRVRREEQRLREIFQGAYLSYAREVPRFLPTLRGIRGRRLLVFDGRLLVENHGHLNLLAVLLGYSILYLSTLRTPCPG